MIIYYFVNKRSVTYALIYKTFSYLTSEYVSCYGCSRLVLGDNQQLSGAVAQQRADADRVQINKNFDRG